ncbi:leucine-rich repeat domain-containing protein [Sphingobacterium siyangense]|uniref:leucine-rich repeat domain-containing protein n=1 Tax=Sphingobacterium siyangense TaxID=459529 RepID=UPI0019635BB6|nr:leucine-rich repeat domain-containing protein [Sphingobacterium siyangense]QRY55949.1 leucine-rich repeat domain-containing protein [Sphingobacterium siyangense]
MKHHFGDFLDRTGDYWTTIPNRERFAFIADFEIGNKDEVEILTISKTQDKKHWEQIFDCPNLEELTLHDPSKEQVQAIRKLTKIKRLRVTFFRATDIEFIGDLHNLEELILEYVSGFSDLTPLSKLTKLKSVHFENLRKVSNFDGLKGSSSLRYLHIDGTFDWNQPIDNFDFLSGLPNLEVFSLGGIMSKAPFPALTSVLTLEKLKKIKIGRNTIPTQEFAFLERALPNVEGAKKEIYRRFSYHSIKLTKEDFRFQLSDEIIKERHPEVRIIYNGTREVDDPSSEWFEFLGKGAGRVKCNNPQADQKIEEFRQKYEQYKIEVDKIIQSYFE